jgi:hypothetical protein
MLEAGGAGTDTERAIPGSEPSQDFRATVYCLPFQVVYCAAVARRPWYTVRNLVGYLALVLACLAVAAWAGWHWAHSLPEPGFFTAWMPNFGTDFLIIAITLVVIDQVQKRQERQRKRLLLDWIWQEIGAAISDFSIAAQYDYTQTHGAHSYKPPPRDAVESLRQWAEGFDTEDTARVDLASVLRAAKSLSAQINRERLTRELDCPELIIAIERYIQAVDSAKQLDTSSPGAGDVQWLLEQVAGAALVLAEVCNENATRPLVNPISEEEVPSAVDRRRQEMMRTRLVDPRGGLYRSVLISHLRKLRKQREKEQREAV